MRNEIFLENLYLEHVDDNIRKFPKSFLDVDEVKILKSLKNYRSFTVFEGYRRKVKLGRRFPYSSIILSLSRNPEIQESFGLF